MSNNQQKGRVGQMAAAAASQQAEAKQPDAAAAETTTAAETNVPAAPVIATAETAKAGAEVPAAPATLGDESAPAAEQAPVAAAAVVAETTTMAAASTGSLAVRGTIAPPRVRREVSAEQQQAPALPQTIRPQQAAAAAPDLLDEVQRILKDVPPTNHFTVLAIVEYCKKASLKNSNDVKTLAVMNVGLWRNITNLINKQDEYFDPLFTALLRVFHLESKNSMSEIAINRGIEHMVLSKQDLAGYMRITTLLRLAADPKSRKQVIKTAVNVPAALRNGLTQEGAARVVAYFETH